MLPFAHYYQATLKSMPSNTTLTADIRIRTIRPLISPAVLNNEYPVTSDIADYIATSRKTISKILNDEDKRLLVVVGPCSIHDPEAALDYARRLKSLSDELSDQLFIVLRVYFEKPRTVVGWKGLINDPDLNGSFNINQGLRLARKLLIDVSKIGLPAANEFLDTTLGQYYADLISWGAIGARTTESQIHRELASGLSMPVGFKNRTDGDIKVAIDAISSARHSHWFPSLTPEGAPAILETTGNQDTHLVLRGGGGKTNYDIDTVTQASNDLKAAKLNKRIMIDCSHANSEKKPDKQIDVALAIADRIAAGDNKVFALMIESNIEAGRQDINQETALKYGQSVTDACLSFKQTEKLLREISTKIK